MNLQQLCAYMVQCKWMTNGEMAQSLEKYKKVGQGVHFVDFLLQFHYINPSQYNQLKELLFSNTNTNISSTGSSQALPWAHANSFSRYRQDKKLGQGGMGKVVLAFDQTLKRPVALKICLSPKPEMVLRFIKEAQIGSQLEHPNIAPVYDAGKVSETQIYISMKYIEGTSLSEIMFKGKKNKTSYSYPLGRRLEIFAKVLEGMAYAHSKTIIHRDIKPENIMIGTFGEVWIVDWGLAKLVEGEPISTDNSETKLDLSSLKEIVSTKTLGGTIAGTPGYMSPEQAYGEQENISYFSDIYSLGVILYEMLTFQNPFEGQTALEILHKVVANQFPPPSEVVPVPPALSAMILTAMAFKPEERYGSVTEMLADLRAYLNGQPLSVYTPPFREKAKTFLRNHSGFLLISCVILSIIAFFGYLLARASSQRVREQKKTIQAQKRTSELMGKKLQAEQTARKNEEARRKAEEGLRKAEEDLRKSFERRYLARIPYMIARDQLTRNMKFWSLKQIVIPKLKKSIDIDPQFYQAQIDLARVYGFLSQANMALGTLLTFFKNLPEKRQQSVTPLLFTIQKIYLARTASVSKRKALASQFQKFKPAAMSELHWRFIKVILFFQLRIYSVALDEIEALLNMPAGKTWEAYYLKARILCDKALDTKKNEEKISKKKTPKFELAKKKALDFFEEILLIYPQVPYFYIARSKFFLEFHKYSRALVDLRKVVTLDPSCDVAWSDLGVVFYQQGVETWQQRKSRAFVLVEMLSSLRYFHRGQTLESTNHRYELGQKSLLAKFSQFLSLGNVDSISQLIQNPSFLPSIKKKYCRKNKIPQLWKEWALLLYDQHTPKQKPEFTYRQSLLEAREILQKYLHNHPQDMDGPRIKEILKNQ